RMFTCQTTPSGLTSKRIKYCVQVMQMVILKCSSLTDIMPQLLKTLAFAVIMNGLAVWSYRKTS
ncbi:MAG: ABC-2 type transport system permease protein, partial [Psychroserpens sp.]